MVFETVHCYFAEITISVEHTVTGKTTSFEVRKSDTIARIRAKIREKGIVTRKQRFKLVFNGKELECEGVDENALEVEGCKADSLPTFGNSAQQPEETALLPLRTLSYYNIESGSILILSLLSTGNYQ